MAITQVGSTLTYAIVNSANTGTVASSITVPAGTQIVVCGCSGYREAGAGMHFGHITFTKAGVDTRMTKANGNADGLEGVGNSGWGTAVFYLAGPDVGASVATLKWDHPGAGLAADSNFLYSLTFWQGIDTVAPVRDSDGAWASNTPVTTPTLVAQSGDLIVAFVGAYAGGAEGTIDTWTNLTLLANLTKNNDADGAWATGSPSGNTTVTAATDSNLAESGIVAVVLKPAAAAASILYSIVGRNSVQTGPGVGTVTSTSFTPANGSLLVVVVPGLISGAPDALLSISDSAGLTWTQRVFRDEPDYPGTYAAQVGIWTTPIVTGTSMTVTANFHTTGGDTNAWIHVFAIQVTGHNTTTPIAQTYNDGLNGAYNAAYSGNFGSAVGANSLVIAGITINGRTIEVGANWTEIVEHSNPGGSQYAAIQIQTRAGLTSAAIVWDRIEAQYAYAIGAIEIAAAADAGGGGSTTKRKSGMIGMGRMMGG